MHIIDELKIRGLIKDFSNEEEVRELLNTKQTVELRVLSVLIFPCFFC